MISSISSGGYSPMMLSGMRGGGGAPDPTKMQENLFSKADANGDGVIDETELSTLVESTGGAAESVGSEALFSQMDADGDGQITQQEATDAASQLLEDLRGQFMQAGRGGEMGGGMPPPPPMGGGPGGMDEEEMFAAIDTDEDGSISEAELTTFFESAPAGSSQATSVSDIFARDDSDGDGLISKDEFTSALEALKSEHRGPPTSSESGSETADSESGTGTNSLVAAMLQLYQSVGQTADNQTNEALLNLFA